MSNRGGCKPTVDRLYNPAARVVSNQLGAKRTKLTCLAVATDGLQEKKSA